MNILLVVLLAYLLFHILVVVMYSVNYRKTREINKKIESAMQVLSKFSR